MNGNFLLPAIKKLCFKCTNQSKSQNLERTAFSLQKKLETNFPNYSVDFKNEIMDGMENDEEDGPIVVPLDEIEASIERSSKMSLPMYIKDNNISKYASKYPFLFASMADEEDILMTCARILDEKFDVTAVREAAAFLEEVEATSTIYKNT